jgi:iron(III) transport system ATP-binding protein
VYVTHDQSEALALSHRIGVMKEGRLVQVGTPREIYGRPANPFVADFVGTTNFIRGTVAAVQAGSPLLRVESELGGVTALATQPMRAGDAVVLTVRPEDVELSEWTAAGVNTWEGVDQKVFLGEAVDFRVRVGSRVLLARAHPRLSTRIGMPIRVAIAADKLLALAAADA